MLKDTYGISIYSFREIDTLTDFEIEVKKCFETTISFNKSETIVKKNTQSMWL
jgi:hypothetical protein